MQGVTMPPRAVCLAFAGVVAICSCDGYWVAPRTDAGPAADAVAQADRRGTDAPLADASSDAGGCGEASGPLRVTASSVPVLEGTGTSIVPAIVPQGGPITFTFNGPLTERDTSFVLLDERDRVLTPYLVPTFEACEVRLTFSPELSAASEFNLVIHAVASFGGQTAWADLWAPIFTEPTATMLKPALEREVLDPYAHVEVVHLTFAEPIGTGAPDGNSLAGADCVLFFSVPLTAGNSYIGDDPGETGNASCLPDLAFEAEEPDPWGLAGRSGFTKYWKLNLPVLPGSHSVPVGTPVSLMFSRVGSSDQIVRRTTGAVVPDFTGTMTLVLP
jgi:hypothetical protein